MTMNAVKHHNYIVRALGGEKIKYVNEIIHGIEFNLKDPLIFLVSNNSQCAGI